MTFIIPTTCLYIYRYLACLWIHHAICSLSYTESPPCLNPIPESPESPICDGPADEAIPIIELRLATRLCRRYKNHPPTAATTVTQVSDRVSATIAAVDIPDPPPSDLSLIHISEPTRPY
eukprot:TRINITY_DN3206_c0_g1_i1.p1 TRINITY_DN3206_c0_g1~~TRINITY_DN3206_c0_g1_i1.p1  ORF type:complete len:120 (-),score=4.47 TRINITY_DN3206_c0_g1_i1:124-483(-)